MKVNSALIFFAMLASCEQGPAGIATDAIKPLVVTGKVFDDSDDPAIWINHANPDSSLVIGTDKNKDRGGLFVFNLAGKIDTSRSRMGMKRVNNVDIAYGLVSGNRKFDIAVCTERDKNSIRVFRLPGMESVDAGGIKVFSGQSENLPMGIALYTRPSDSAIFAIVGRKTGPAENYLEQYLLIADSTGTVTGKLVRSFGKFSGKKEIESIAVDNETGYVYYSDEGFGTRKYYADPAKGGEELAVFGQGEFAVDNEGISVYKTTDSTGYILVSNQGENTFNIYRREGDGGSNPHHHTLLKKIPFSTLESDGSDVSAYPLPGFPGGLFVAMSTDGTFHYYSWKQVAEKAGLDTRQSR